MFQRSGDQVGVTIFDPRAPREFWLDGESVMCACPDCGAPMSIRLWLLAADCWQCGCSIELSAEQERRIHSLLRSTDAKTAASPEALAEPSSQPGPSMPAHRPSIGTAPRNESRSPAKPRPPRAERQRSVKPSWRRRSEAGGRVIRIQHDSHGRGLRDWLSAMPAWLISMLFHMALLALFALFMVDGGRRTDPYITLSTEANRWRRPGGDITPQDAMATFHFDLPIPERARPRTPLERQAIARADQAARELRLDPAASVPQLPTLRQVKRNLRSADATHRALAARDPRVRVEVVTSEGGTTLTEAAVSRGLRWLSQHQNADGSWSLHRFSKAKLCLGKCGGDGNIRSDSAATSLSLLPFLGAGQTHHVGIYQATVAKGLRWLLEHQQADGDLRAKSSGNSGMYAHGQGAIVLCEAFALTRDEQLRDAAQRSIDFIVQSQHPEGGWRYRPGERGDTSVLGWQLMALQSARAAQLDVPEEPFELAGLYLDSVQYADGSRYAYQPGRRPSPTMTAEALLCRMYLGWTKDFAGLEQGVRYLVRDHMPSDAGTNFYYWYYATQVLHHFGGQQWQAWNLEMRDLLVESQIRRGHQAGSWDPVGDHTVEAGRLYSTALAVCTLEVYYRHAPIFRQLDLE